MSLRSVITRGGGEPLSSAFDKLNQNDADLYKQVQGFSGSVDGKAPLASPVFSGTVRAPVLALTGTGSTGQIDGMSVAGVPLSSALGAKAPLANPSFSGTVSAPAIVLSGSGSTGSVDGMSVGGVPLSSVISRSGGKTTLTPDAITGDGSGASVPIFGGFTAKLGDAVPTLDVPRNEMNTRVIPFRSFVSTGFNFAGDGGGGARYVRGTSSDFMAVQDAAGVWFKLDLSGRDIPAAWVGVIANDSSKAVSNAAAINALYAALGAAGGGRVILPTGNVYVGATLDNTFDYVTLRGGGVLYVNQGTPVYSTTIIPTFAGTVLKDRTLPTANHVKNGGGIDGVRIIGNSIATRLVEIGSGWGGTYRIRAEDSVGADAIAFEVFAISGANGAGNFQRAEVDISVQQTAPGAASNAHCIIMEGDAASNVSINDRMRFDVVHINGDGLRMANSDNNMIWLRSYRVPGGTGAGLRSKAGSNYQIAARANIFTFLSMNSNAVFEGTETATFPSISNVVQYLDTDNGTPIPTVGTGAQAYVENAAGTYAPTVTAGGGSLGTGVVTGGRWHQTASGLVTVFVTISLPNASGALSVLRVSLPAPPRAGMIEGSAVGKEISVTGKALVGIVDSTAAAVQFYDGSLAGQSGMNIRLKIEYQG